MHQLNVGRILFDQCIRPVEMNHLRNTIDKLVVVAAGAVVAERWRIETAGAWVEKKSVECVEQWGFRCGVGRKGVGK